MLLNCSSCLPPRLKYVRPKRIKALICTILFLLSISVAFQLISHFGSPLWRTKPITKDVNYLLSSHQQAKSATDAHATVANDSHNTFGVSSSKRENVTVSLQRESNLSACPDLKDIPGLVSDRKMLLTEEFSMTHLESVMCPNQPSRLGKVSAEGMRLLLRSENPNMTRSIVGRESQVRAQCADYVYLPGGHWRPASCKPRWKVAIVVPYRNRIFQLSIFLRYMIPFLQKQQLEFAIYIVNQANDEPFNRGMLLNIGFTEALKFAQWDCFVFHDVDHLPQNEANPYGCVNLPRHFISGADNRNYKVPYSTSFGGVTGFTTVQYQDINGFGNVYWGWCCEDDDLEQRVRIRKLHKTRNKGNIGYYRAITTNHHKSKEGLSNLEKLNREALRSSMKRFKTDGLSNLHYKLRHLELATLYTNISVDIWRTQPKMP